MDMHVPDAPLGFAVIDNSRSSATPDVPEILVAGHNLPMQRPNKRRREDDRHSITSPSKLQASQAAWASRGEPSEELRAGVHEAEDLPATSSSATHFMTASPQKPSERMIAPGLRHTQVRNVIQYVVNEGLKVGGRPESAIARETDHGEIIEVQTRTPTGELRNKLIEWSVDSAVPTTMFGKFPTAITLYNMLTPHSR